MNNNQRVARALTAATDTVALEIGIDILDKVPVMFKEHFPGRKAMVVADKYTWQAAGEAVQAYLQQSDIECEEPFIFDYPNFHAEWTFVKMLDDRLASTNAIAIAVGSGTINDLCKLCSYRQYRQYMCVATVASVDGYSSFGASVIHKNMKKTFTCPAPKVILADAGVMAKAPVEMTAAGYADLAAKIPSGTEWMLADFLGVELVHNVAWHIVHDGLKESLSDPIGVAERNPKAIATLVEGLMLSGFAMQAARSSIPASGTEHLFSHLWNMRGHTHNGRTPSHGYQVSVGTLMMCAMFDEMCKTDFSKLDVRACVSLWKNRRQMRHEAEDLFEDMPYGDYVIAESMARYKDKEEVRRQLQLMKDNWPDIKEMLQEHCFTHEQMYQLLSTVGAPTSPEQVGISLEQMRSDVAIVRHIRNRFTMFDIGLYAGKLQDWTAGVFGEGGIWEIK